MWAMITCFCDIAYSNREALTIIEKDLETVSCNICRVFQQPTNQYSKQTIDGVEHRKYDNLVEMIGADTMNVKLYYVVNNYLKSQNL